jgi:predicted NBD/HSP70 family sugar kinase
MSSRCCDYLGPGVGGGVIIDGKIMVGFMAVVENWGTMSLKRTEESAVVVVAAVGKNIPLPMVCC